MVGLRCIQWIVGGEGVKYFTLSFPRRKTIDKDLADICDIPNLCSFRTYKTRGL